MVSYRMHYCQPKSAEVSGPRALSKVDDLLSHKMTIGRANRPAAFYSTSHGSLPRHFPQRFPQHFPTALPTRLLTFICIPPRREAFRGGAMVKALPQSTGGSEAILAGSQIAHDLLGPAANGVHADLSINALDTIASHIAQTTQYLHGFPRTELHYLTGLHLQ